MISQFANCYQETVFICVTVELYTWKTYSKTIVLILVCILHNRWTCTLHLSWSNRMKMLMTNDLCSQGYDILTTVLLRYIFYAKSEELKELIMPQYKPIVCTHVNYMYVCMFSLYSITISLGMIQIIFLISYNLYSIIHTRFIFKLVSQNLQVHKSETVKHI